MHILHLTLELAIVSVDRDQQVDSAPSFLHLLELGLGFSFYDLLLGWLGWGAWDGGRLVAAEERQIF